MKILLISPKAPPKGGIATWTEEFLQSNIIKENEISLINIAVLEKRINSKRKMYILEELKRLLMILKDLKENLKKQQFDVAHINSSCSKFGLIREWICVKILKRKKIKIVIHFHCDIPYMLKGKLPKIFFKSILKNVNNIIVLNKTSNDYIKKYYKNNKIYIVPNFIDEKYLKDTNKEISKNVKTIIFVGRISVQKGCLNIIDVAKKFPDIKFELIGPIEENFNNINISDNLIMTGAKDDVITEIDKGDLFLFPTYTEGFPCALLEAMARGLPIIATKVGAITDMIEDSGGIYCEVNNSEQIESLINKIKDDVENRKRMSEWNINKVKNNYLKNKIISEILNIYLK